MATTFTPGQTISQGDLDIYLTDSGGFAANAYEVTYAIYFVDPAPPHTEVLIGPSARVPVNPQVGEYYASLQVPPSAVPGSYRIRWSFRQFAGSPVTVVVQEWTVVSPGTVVTSYTGYSLQMIRSLRVLLRDQNPDKFYHFRPPEAEGNIGSYNRVFGQVWEDAELYEYLERALDWWNMMPPMTSGVNTIDRLVTEQPAWRTAVQWQAIVHACFALSTNWVADEFDYSIGGISLSIEKSSKYQGLMDSASQQFDKAAEAKTRTVRFMRGLQQSKYGMGVKSAFGPHTGRGILSPRNFVIFPLIPVLYTILHHLSSVVA